MHIQGLYLGNCLSVLKLLPDNSVDALCCDPPAGISFMGKEWDADKGGRNQWINWMTEVMQECLRVLKPGAHGLVWAIPRTSHWTAMACEYAGFEIRDVITHLFGSGFPKSLDISKAIDKAAGESRKTEYKPNFKNNDYGKGMGGGQWNAPSEPPKTREAIEWQGWGTALKPASEHWILVRKPISEKTVAANILKHGCGGINIDASRIAIDSNDPNSRPNGSIPLSEGGKGSMFKMGGRNPECDGNTLNLAKGRFPANLVLSHNDDCEAECVPSCAVAELDRQSGNRPGFSGGGGGKTGIFKTGQVLDNYQTYSDSGGASRFFYCAKASKSEKNAGCEGLPEKRMDIGDERPSGNSWERRGRAAAQPRQNTHPTVKPLKLMSYLIKMVTPPGGIVLDPFAGSGSTCVAAVLEGFTFLGIEQEREYYTIALE